MQASTDKECTPTVIATFCETRFELNHLVLRPMLKVISPLRAMCAMDELEGLARKNSAARRVIDIIAPSTFDSFRENAVLVDELMSPVMDEMHKIEAYRPVSSSMRPLNRGLIQHANDFANKHPHLAMPMP
jgi:hypothetical protein